MELNELVKNHYTSLYQYALKLTRHTQKAEDLTQDTLVKIHKGFSKFRQSASFSTWSKTVMKNCYIDIVRKDKRKWKIQVENSGAGHIEDRSIEKEFSELLDLVNLDLLENHITELQKTILYHTIFLKESYSEVGEQIGLTKGLTHYEMRKIHAQIEDIESFK